MTEDLLEQGIALATAGRWEQAQQILLELTKADPECFEAWLWLGATADDPAESVRHLERAVALRPQSIRAKRGLEWAEARFYGTPVAEGVEVGVNQDAAFAVEVPSETEDSEADLELLEPPIIDWDDILARLRALDTADLDSPRRYAPVATLQPAVEAPIAETRFTEMQAEAKAEAEIPAINEPLLDESEVPAVAEMEAAPEPEPEPELAAPRLSYDDLMRQGAELLQDEAFVDAAKSFRQALEVEPGSLAALDQLGVAYYRAGQLEDALVAFKELAQRQPDHAEAPANVGFLLAELGRVEEALSAFQTAVRIDPNLVEAYISIGDILRAQGNSRGAIEAWDRAISLRPGLTDVHVRLADLYHEIGQPEESAWEIGLAIEQRPTDAGLYLKLTRALTTAGKVTEAVQRLETAVLNLPDRADLLTELGRLQLQQGQQDEAITRFEEALAVDPTYGPAKEELEALRAAETTPPSPQRRGFLGLFRPKDKQ